jgi:hypothetical protein
VNIQRLLLCVVRRDINARAALRVLAWPLAVVAAAHVPATAAALPALGVVRGPVGWIALALVCAVAVNRALAGGASAPRRAIAPAPRALFAAAAVLYVAMGLWYASRLRVSGDEPHYLLMAQSLWREADLDLADNLAREDWRENTPGPLLPHFGAPRADGRPFPAHSPGLPLLLAPLYALGGRLLCVAALALAAAGATVVAWHLAGRVPGGGEGAFLGWAVALGPPVAFYAFHIYTEVPSALAIAGALALILGPLSLASGVSAALLAAALPWLHLKMIPAAAALGVIAALRLRGRVRLAFFLVAAGCAAGYLAYYDAIFGIASPLAIYGGLPVGERGSPVRALVGLLLDRSYGLIWHAPVFLVALAGLPEAWRRRLWPHALLAVAVLAPVLWWRMWWGGQCPPARFLVPLVPLLAVCAALRADPASPIRGLARWRWVLAALGLAVAVFAAARPGDLLLLNRGDRPTRLWAALSGDVDVERYLPSLVTARPDEDRVAVVWVVVLVVLLVLDALARRVPRVDRLFAGTGLPVVLLLAAGAGIDSWARRGEAIAPTVTTGRVKTSASAMRSPKPVEDGGVPTSVH